VNKDKLIRMANQIGGFFAAMPDREQATRDIAGHLARNWTPRMRDELAACLDEEGSAKLAPQVREALRYLTPRVPKAD
jgi:formate dehydrogenase subunit delta